MLSPEMLRIILMLSLAATGYVLILTWNQDSQEEQKQVDTNNSKDAQQKVATQPVDLLPMETEEHQDIPDQSFLVTKPEVNLNEGSGLKLTLDSAADRIVRIDTPTLQVWIDRLGGDIVRINLPRYPRQINVPDDPLFLLIKSQELNHYYVAQSGLIGPDGPDGKTNRPLYEVNQSYYKIEEGETLELKLFTASEGADITKVFYIKAEEYLIDVDHIVNNKSDNNFRAGLFAQIKRDNQQPPDQEQPGLGMQAYVGGAITTPEEKYRKIDFEDVDENPVNLTTQGGWVAFLQHYFLTAWIPEREELNRYTARRLKDGNYAFGFTGPLFELAPGEQKTWSTHFYAGPKDQDKLADIAPNLNLTVDYGFLFFIAEPLFWLLDWLHDFSGNWGIAIILLTFIVKLALYPLSAAGYKSMANMRRVAPQLKKIQERYSNDREKLQKEMMEMYKREGANPLGGCLPMLLPMPIFIALYWVLLEAVELRHAPFMLWIEDLAVMDPYFVLPILMAGTMYFMQTLNPQVGDPLQIKMMKAMPFVFLILFLWFPAGLVLYWLVNNILSIAQQWYVIRQTERARNISKA